MIDTVRYRDIAKREEEAVDPVDPTAGISALLHDRLASFKALPVLFVGSGLSRRYLGTPGWNNLLDHFAKKLGHDVRYYLGKTPDGPPGVATEIAKDFYEVWWNQPEYKDSRDSFSSIVAENADPLKIEVAKYIADFATTTHPARWAELAELRRAKVHAIITTNWDTLLEDSFPDFQTYVGQEHVLFSEVQGVGEIYKIHGSVEDPSGLVLTTGDYGRFRQRNPYLIAKLLTFFVEHPVVFLGYSLTDPHIQALLLDLLRCLSTENIVKLSERIFFVRRASGTAADSLHVAPMVLDGNAFSVTEVVTEDFLGVFNAMSRLSRRFPIKLLRQIKKDLYELAYADPVGGRIKVVDLDDDTTLDKVDVVIGVGTHAMLGKLGYRQLDRHELTLAMLRDDHEIDGAQLMQHVVPRLFANSTKYAPIFYPLRLAGRISGGIVSGLDELPPRARDLASGAASLTPYYGTLPAGTHFRDLLADRPERHIDHALSAEYDTDDIEALRQFLLGRFESARVETVEYRLACLYDRLAFGPDVP